MTNSTSHPAGNATKPPDAPRLIVRVTSLVDRLDLKVLFPKDQPLEVELGSGDGSFLAQYAKAHPEHNFIGVERLLGRLRKLDKKGVRAGLQNLRLMRLEAAYLVEYLIPHGSVQALHVYFPDPWPKRRHHKNRLINQQFTSSAAQALAPGGKVFLRTDDANYFAQMQEVFAANPDFTLTETPPELAAIVTDFERDFNARGISTLRVAFERIAPHSK